MRVMLLAAGRGDRLRPLTDTRPKPLLEAGGKPLIVHLIEALVRADHRQIVINHAWLGEQIEAVIQDGAQYGAEVCYSPEPEGALGTGGGILNALPLLGEAAFIAVNADIYTDYPFGDLPSAPLGLAHLVLVDNPPHNPAGDFHLAEGEVRTQGDPRLTFSGIGVYRPALFADREPGCFPLGPLLRETAEADRVSGERCAGEWWDVGSPERLEALRLRLANR
jgi:MurNAc alpha-1-phosphate uridylyltransferase